MSLSIMSLLTGMWYHLALFYDDLELGVAYTTVAMATAVSGRGGALTRG